jgi:predicted PurR-regulated permease PerM
MTRKQIFFWFFFGIFLFLIYLCYEILQPFIFSLFWAGMLALILYPFHERLTRALKSRNAISSLMMTTIATSLIILPLVMVVTTFAIEMFDVYGEMKNQIEIAKVKSVYEHLKEFIPLNILQEVEKRFNVNDIHPEEVVVKTIGIVSNYLFDEVQKGAKNLTVLIFDFCIMVFALFFFFKDGKRLYEDTKYLIPMEDDQKNRIFSRFYNILNAILLGVMATAGLQGLIAGLIFRILGISFPVLAGVLTFVFCLLPVGGSTVVWLPVGVYLLLTGGKFKGIALLILGSVILSTVDHFLKPMIIGGRTKLPLLFLFLFILGGLKVFGFSGIILGPVVLAVFLSFIEIYKVEYRETQSDNQGDP